MSRRQITAKADRPSVCFVPFKGHLKPLFREMYKDYRIDVVRYPTMHMDAHSSYPEHTLHFLMFGLQYVVNLLKKEIYMPVFVVGLKPLLTKLRPKNIVAFDVYHWYIIQCLQYVRKHPDTRLHIYAETSAWPSNFFARTFFRSIVWYVQRHAGHLATIFVYSEQSKKFMQTLFPNSTIAVLPAGVASASWYPPVQRKRVQNADFKLLMNARYTERKRHIDLFAAVETCVTHGLSVSLTCIGRPEEGRRKLEAYVREQNFTAEIQFVDAVASADEMRAIYHSHDVLVLPSSNEAIGMVVPEAMACGLPTITSDAVGANTYLSEGETGLIFKTGNVDALVDAIRQYADPRVRELHGSAAAQQISEKYSTEAIASKFSAALSL